MRKTISLLVLSLVLCLSSLGFASDFDFDDLFGDDLFMEIQEEEGTFKPEEILLVNEGLELGGNYSLSVDASRLYPDKGEAVNSLEARLGGQLYLDARPDPDFRLFSKARFNYAIPNGEQNHQFDVKLLELFSDFNYENKVFFRAGKQRAEWGVGYFFSPADVINLGRIDPENPTADREGPIALKVHYPHKSNNYYLYTIFEGISKPEQIAIAPKMEYLLGKSELGAGLFYQKDKSTRGMLTISSSFGNVGWFAEGVVGKDYNKDFLESVAPGVYRVVKKDDFFTQATIGAHYSYKDEDDLFNFSGAVQYYFNGVRDKEHRDSAKEIRLTQANNSIPLVYPFVEAILKEGADATEEQIMEYARKLSPFLMEDGLHYLGATVMWNNMLGTKLSNSTFVLANLSDRSGMVTNTLSLPRFSKFSPSVGVSFFFGDEASEYGLLGRNTKIFAGVTIGSGSF